jgi:hypothetical protein
MELTLNLGWVLLATLMLYAWVQMAPRRTADRRLQLIALGLVILILLPAISMTDDLVAAQNPAEVDCCARRDHDSARSHSIVPVIAALPAPTFDGLPIGFVRIAAPGHLSAPFVKDPALAPIQNRPPPAA